MKPKHQRLLFISAALLMVGIATLLLLRNLEDYVVYFYAPSDIIANPPQAGQYIRVGGLVKQGSVMKPDEETTQFIITDMQHELTITYTGMLPNLFREGQGIIAEGSLQDNQIIAKTILAKHDEYYMPPEVSKSLKKSGHWKGGQLLEEGAAP